MSACRGRNSAVERVTMSLILTGEWLGVERRSGSSKNDDGEMAAWAFTNASVLDGLEVRRLRVPDKYLQEGGQYPPPRSHCQLLITVRAFNRRNGVAEAGWELVEWLDDPNGQNANPDSKKG